MGGAGGRQAARQLLRYEGRTPLAGVAAQARALTDSIDELCRTLTEARNAC